MALFTNKYTVDAQPEELSVFTIPSTQTAVERAFYEEFRPVSSQIGGDGPIQFTISGNGSDYIDLNHSKLWARIKIVKGDGSDLTADDVVSLVNQPLQSMWSQIDVVLQGRTISTASTYYPYKAYFQSVLNTSVASKEALGTAELYYEDTAGAMETTDPVGAPLNSGLYARHSFTKSSKSVDLEGVLYSDIFKFDRYLLNGVDLQLKLYKNKMPFCLMVHGDGVDYKIVIEDIVFKVRKIKLNPSVIIGHSKELQNTTAKYPFVHTEVKTAAIAAGMTSFTYDNIFQGKVPSRIMVAIVKDAALTGSYKLNPFNFAHYNVSSVGATLDGENIGGRPYRLNYDENQFISTFVKLKESTTKSEGDFDNGLSRDTFGKGYAIYTFDIEPNFNFDYLSLTRKGNLRLEIIFSKAVEDTLSCVLYCEFQSLLEIDSTRNIIYNPQ